MEGQRRYLQNRSQVCSFDGPPTSPWLGPRSTFRMRSLFVIGLWLVIYQPRFDQKIPSQPISAFLSNVVRTSRRLFAIASRLFAKFMRIVGFHEAYFVR
jgi:hypothetical protein